MLNRNQIIEARIKLDNDDIEYSLSEINKLARKANSVEELINLLMPVKKFDKYAYILNQARKWNNIAIEEGRESHKGDVFAAIIDGEVENTAVKKSAIEKYNMCIEWLNKPENTRYPEQIYISANGSVRMNGTKIVR